MRESMKLCSLFVGSAVCSKRFRVRIRPVFVSLNVKLDHLLRNLKGARGEYSARMMTRTSLFTTPRSTFL